MVTWVNGIGQSLAVASCLALVGCIFPDNGESCRSHRTSSALICFQVDPNDCGLTPGCSATETCQVSACFDLDFDACSQESYCAWVDTWGCRPGDLVSGVPCQFETTQEDCEQLDYCTWKLGCDGDPPRVKCDKLDREECEQHADQCYWNLGGQG